MTCAECQRIARYMAADPEMYRGEEAKCAAHRREGRDGTMGRISGFQRSRDELLAECDRLRGENEALCRESDSFERMVHEKQVELAQANDIYLAMRSSLEDANSGLRDALARSESARKVAVEALRKVPHDILCHPSEGVHSVECQERKAALAQQPEEDR